MAIDIGKRKFISALGAATVAWPLAARAQQGDGMRRIGILASTAQDDPITRERIAAFQLGLNRLGWIEGRNIRIEVRYSTTNIERMAQLAMELVALNPDVIFAQTTSAIQALQRQTRAIPVVFTGVSDPIGSGFVASLARPGGNITGFLLYEDSIAGKWLALLKEVAPRLDRAALLANAKATPFDYFLRSAKTVAPTLGIEVVPAYAEDSGDIESTIESLARAANAGLIVLPDSYTFAHRDLIVALAARHRLPAVYAFRAFVTAGGLMSYDTDLVEQSRQAAIYIDRILRGEKPADLPVQAPTKYEFVVNLKTAKALGLTVPQSLLATADEVIK
jgi:putative tryptophan/tyrosine transport system substrate-binding protein